MRVLHFDGVNGLRLQTIKGIQIGDQSKYDSGKYLRSSLTEDVLDRFYSELKYMSYKAYFVYVHSVPPLARCNSVPQL